MKPRPSPCADCSRKRRGATGRWRSRPRWRLVSEIARRRTTARHRTARDVAREELSATDIARIIGPGVISGGADNDPAGIATYSVAGATAGFAQNWLLLLSTPMLIVVQQMSAKVANVTKTDLANLLRTIFGARV